MRRGDGAEEARAHAVRARAVAGADLEVERARAVVLDPRALDLVRLDALAAVRRPRAAERGRAQALDVARTAQEREERGRVAGRVVPRPREAAVDLGAQRRAQRPLAGQGL